MVERQNHCLRGLYAITPDGLAPDDLLERVAAALHGGLRILQYRDKQRDPVEQAEIAKALSMLCRKHGTCFIVNDDLELALSIGADGVHLGGDDGNLVEARRMLGAGRLLGASCYADFERARAAVAAGADYVAFGAVCSSPTKPLAARAPLGLFSRARRELNVPLCAIGGITLADAPAIIDAGADLLAVISDLFSASDVTSRVQAYQSLFMEKSRV